MEILNAKHQLLTNYEVLTILKSLKKSKDANESRNLATITYETIHHLEQMPCKDQTEENIHEFIKNIKRFNITKSEALNMVNEPPTAPLHIQLIVEDSEERLTDDQVEEIITLSKRYLILEPKDDAEEVMPN